MTDEPNPLLPGYTHRAGDDGEDSIPWTWKAWCDQPTKAATLRAGKTYIGAGTFANRSLCLTDDEHAGLAAAGVVLIHPASLPEEAVE